MCIRTLMSLHVCKFHFKIACTDLVFSVLWRSTDINFRVTIDVSCTRAKWEMKQHKFRVRNNPNANKISLYWYKILLCVIIERKRQKHWARRCLWDIGSDDRCFQLCLFSYRDFKCGKFVMGIVWHAIKINCYKSYKTQELCVQKLQL